LTRPVFYYANGTAYLFNGGPNFVMGALPGVPINIKGLDGPIYWDGTIPADPFPLLLNESLWEYKRVPYPASTAFIGPSVEVGAQWVMDQIKATPVGTPFALGGYSQGAAVMSRVYTECRQGQLINRRSDLRAMVTFGNPMREKGHTFPNSGGYSGACDMPGDTLNGHGVFPALEDIGLFSPLVQKFARLQNTEDLVWDFTMPNETIGGVGSETDDGRFLQRFTYEGLRLLPLTAILGLGRSQELGALFSKAPAGVPSNSAGEVGVVDAVTGVMSYRPGGGHIMYSFYPPPNADGSIPTSGDTCYQLAAKYLNTVGARIYDEQNPTVVAPTTRAAFSWFTSLPGG
jgi:hypothetical protein